MASKKAKSEPAPEPIERLLHVDAETERLICKAIAEYKGPATTLESAIGALVLGQHFGSRALRMIHNPATFRKYEQILGVEFSDQVPERTHLSTKLIGIKVADKLGKFWDIVMGREKVQQKGFLGDPDQEDPK